MHGWAAEVIAAVGEPETSQRGPERLLHQVRGRPCCGPGGRRPHVRGAQRDRDAPTTWQTRLAQYDAVCEWGQPNHALLERVSAIDKPVFVANGDSDPMILPRYSYLLAGLIPDARPSSTRTPRTVSSSNTTPSSPRTSRVPGRRMTSGYERVLG